MKPKSFTTGRGRHYKIPIDEPLVAAHFDQPCSLTDELLRQINAGMYDRHFLGKKDMVFLDLGANIGLVSIYAADACSRIVAVEPSPDTYAVLKAMTKSLPWIKTVQAAISPHNGECEFFVNDVNSTASSTVNTYGTRTSVRGITLTTLLKEQRLTHVDFCKVDIEGGEGESLNLAELSAAKDIVQSWYIETHNCPKTTWEHKLGELVKILSHLGYHHMEITGMGLYARKPKP